jgi:GNAT superfamily N-acetyltransferase/dephospho-CoA kinase
MINWDKTKALGTQSIALKRLIIAKCDTCGAEAQTRILYKEKIEGEDYRWKCKKCRYEDPEYRKKLKERWTPEYRERASKSSKKQWTPEYCEYMSKLGKDQWSEEYRKMMDEKYYSTPEYKEKLSKIQEPLAEHKSELAKQQWQDPAQREILTQAISRNAKKLWTDPEYREKVSTSDKIFYNNPEIKMKLSEQMKQRWLDQEFYDKMMAILRSEEHRERSRALWRDNDYRKLHIDYFSTPTFKEILKARWKDPIMREQMMVKFTPELRAKLSEISKRLMTPERRAKQSLDMKKLWSNPEYVKMHFEAMKSVSSIQILLYSILDDLGVKYYREYNEKSNDLECLVGPWPFDCVVPRTNKPTLLIECQGEWVHSRKEVIQRDKAKASYIGQNLSNQYELKYIWEHEFLNKGKVASTLRYWLGLEQPEAVDFNFDDVNILPCPAKDYRLLLSKYHYLPNAGRGGEAIGAFLKDELIAVCVFSPLVRQNLPFDVDKTRELSRLCIHPRYQKSNFGSWFISRCIKQLSTQYDTIISYCDTTYNHDGAIYKASNFILDAEVDPDYWYVAPDGWVMHKKTLYNHAVNNQSTEREWAELNNYRKVWGGKKLRFVYRR